jgi:hypothetical protein
MKIYTDTTAIYDVTGIPIPTEDGCHVITRISPPLLLKGEKIIDRLLQAERHVNKMVEGIKNLKDIKPNRPTHIPVEDVRLNMLNETKYICARSLGDGGFETNECEEFPLIEEAILDLWGRIKETPSIEGFLVILVKENETFRVATHAEITNGVKELL